MTPKNINALLLRYRDFDEEGKTISQHKEIISESGGVWWGWWKKNSEDDNVEYLERNQSRCGADGSISLGIFDRSTKKYHFAECTRVVHSKEGIFCPDKRSVPGYYAEFKLPAWFYIKSLSEVMEGEFVNTFGAVPHGTDATMFPVVDGRVINRDNFVTYFHDKIPPLSILHISDVHFGGDFGFPASSKYAELSILDRLRRDVRKLENAISLIVFSGDITTRANVEGMRVDGLKFLTSLCEICKVDRQQMIIVPGNHDLPLHEVEPTDYSHESEFRGFLKDFYGVNGSSSGLRVFEHNDGERTEVLAMNSVRLRTKNLKNFGYVEWGLYEDNLYNAQLDEEANKLAVLHHHLIPVPLEEELDAEYPYANASTTIDSGSVINGLHAHGFKYAFHGHQHVPGVFKVARGRLQEDRMMDLNASLTVIAAGSLTSSRLGSYMNSNSYNHLHKKEGNFVLTSTEYTKATAETKLNFKCSV